MHSQFSRPILLAALGAALLLCNTARAGIDAPPVQDPQILDWAGKASAALDAYLANPQATFAMPAEGKSFPCEVPPEVMTRIVGVRLPGVAMEEPERKMWAKILRGQPGAKPMENSDVAIRLVQAECKDGKPAGTVKGWVEYTTTMPSAAYVSSHSWRKYFEASVGPDGTRQGPFAERMLMLRSSMTWSDPAMADLMAKNPSPEARTATFIYTLPLPDKSIKGVTLTHVAVAGTPPTATLAVMEPEGPGRWKMVSYNGKVKEWEVPMRNGRMHGKQIQYPRTFSGVQIPGSMICWDDGEQIKTTQCDVD